MRHFFLSLLPVTLLLTLACSRPEPAKDPKVVAAVGDGGKVVVAPPVDDKDVKTAGAVQPLAQSTKESAFPIDSDDDKYEAALSEGLAQMAEQKWSLALLSFQGAQRVKDNEFIRGEIVKLKLRVDQEAAAQKTVGDIEKVLEEGKASDAAQLAQQALREFGDGDVSDQLVKLRLQADALVSAAKRENDEARIARYRAEADAALREQNLRAAAIAFEQAVQVRADARVQQQLDDIRDKLQKYDGLRRRAQELRRDPQQLEDALAALNDAAKHWDTLQVRQEIDECNLALQKRRDNISVADFEARVDVGFPDAGRTIAEELLPHFKSRFDLVERAQIGKVIQELKLEDSFDDDIDQQRELARLAKVRYLVLGSVSPLSGVTVSARLVDARSGLVVQTGKIAAPTVEQAVRLLPALARQLMMSDDEKIAYDQAQARLAKRFEPPPDNAPLPPPPPPQVAVVVQAPPVVEIPAPPPFAGLTFEHFRRLPPPPAVFVKFAAPPPPTVVVNHRLLHASLQLGDDLYRRGRYAEAHRHFDFALNLAPGNFDLRLRLERVQPHLPPPRQIVIVDPVPAPIVVRHRIAILDFATFGDPRVVPPGLGPWTSYHLAPYFRSRYDVVDPSEVYFWMGRLGMTMRDLLDDAGARRWLARAVGVRYLVVGALVETASFNVHTYMIDAEFGYLHSSAFIHAHNPRELKLRLGELAHLTMVDQVERARILAEQDRFNALIVRGRQHFDRRDFAVAVTVFDDALRLRPGHVEVLFHLNNARRQAEIFALEEARRQQYLRQQAFAAEAARRQFELARAAELARGRAAQQFALLADVDRRRLEEERLHAHQDLLVRARVAIKTNNFSLAVDFFKGAADIVPPRPVVVGFTPQQDIYRELALARAESERAAQVQGARAAAAREAAIREDREKQLAIANAKLAKTKQALAASHKKADEERDRLLYQASFDQGQLLFSQGNFAAALSSFQAARRVKPTPAVDQWIKQSAQQQALAGAKDDTERKQLEAKLASETERRKTAEAEAERKQKAYQAALLLANQALAQKQFAVAEAKYHEAGKLFKTDAVLTGLRKAEAGRTEIVAKAKAEQEETVRLKQLLAQGRSALDAKEYGKALAAYQQAKKLAPGNVEVLAGLSQAEDGRVKQSVSAKREQQVQDLMATGKKALAAKKYEEAVKVLSAAAALDPEDKSARDLLRQAQKAQANASFADDVGKIARDEKVKDLLSTSRAALKKKDYTAAEKALNEAKKIAPNDADVAEALRDLSDARKTSETAKTETKKTEATKTDTDFQQALAIGQKAMETKNYKAAIQAYQVAAKLKPNDSRVPGLLEIAQREQRRIDAVVAEYDSYMAFGQKAFAGKNYKGAIQAFQEAARVMPGDPRAAGFLKQAQIAAQADAKTKDDPKKKDDVKKKDDPKKEDVKKKEEKKKVEASDPQLYQQYLTAGTKALKAKKYDDAVKWFSAAQKLMPDEPLPGQYLKQAQKLLDESKGADPKKKKMSWIVPEERWQVERPVLLASTRRVPLPAVSPRTRADSA